MSDYVSRINLQDSTFSEAIINEAFDESKMNIVLGSNEKSNFNSLLKMNNLLVGGGAKSGKTEFLYTTIASLILKNSPEELRLLLIDSNGADFDYFDDLPQLLAPVVKTPETALNGFKLLNQILDERLKMLKEAGFKNIDSYNKENPTKLYYIVCVIDEFAELIFSAGKTFDKYLNAILNKGKLVGIHLVLASQTMARRYGNVFPTRFAFKMYTVEHSIELIDAEGAEKLNGNGDVMYKFMDDDILRLQAPFIPEDDIKKIVDYQKSIYSCKYIYEKEFLEDFEIEQEEIYDELFEDVARYVADGGAPKVETLMRVFEIEEKRANRLLTMMEKREIVSKEVNGKRETLVTISELAGILKK